MMGKIPEAWRIISGTGIYNRRPDILRLRRIDLRNSGGISVWGGEPLEALRTAGNSRGRLAWPSPLRLVQRYSKCSPLTVLLWPQVQNYSLTKLRLMLVGAMALAIQRFLGSNQRVGHQPTGGSMPHPGHRQMKRRMPMGNRRIAYRRISNQRCKVEAPVRQPRRCLHPSPQSTP